MGSQRRGITVARAPAPSTFRVWFRQGDRNWWEPVAAESEEQVLKQLSYRKRKLVSKVTEIACVCAVS